MTVRVSGVGPLRRRPAALLVALALGGVLAGVFGLPGASPAGAAPADAEVVDVVEALEASENSVFAEQAETMPQMAITEAQAQQRLAEVAASRAERDAAAAAAEEAARPDAVMPVDGARMTTCFCQRWGTMHWGIDLAAPMLTPEYAAEDGVVVKAGAASGYGQAVYILGVSGDVTIYGHMEEIEVSAGDTVEMGQTIALLGSRGQSTGPHLHFEVHEGGINGQPVDPEEWLRDRGVDI